MTRMAVDGAHRRAAVARGRDRLLPAPAVIGVATGPVVVKARTLLLLYAFSLAGAAAADPIGAPRHDADGWIFGPPDEGYDLRSVGGPPAASDPHADHRLRETVVRRRVPHTGRNAAVIPLPRPRPYVLETTGAIALDAVKPVAPPPATAPIAQPTAPAAPGTQNASTSQPASALASATEQDVAGDTDRRTYTAETPTWAAVEPVKDNGDGAMPPVSVSDTGGGRVEIKARDASLGQVLAALQASHLIQVSASDPLSRALTGNYSGTLPQVLSRILDGYNYFLRVTASGTELHVIKVASSGTTSAWHSVSTDTNAALPGSNVDAATVPGRGFSLSPPSPAKARARAH